MKLDGADELSKLLRLKEDLQPELQACFREVEGMPCIQHPLVYSVPHAPGLNALLNRSLEAKKLACQQALAERQFLRYVFLHERPWRINAFLAVEQELSDTAYWDLLREVYQDSENVEETPALWHRAMHAARAGRSAMMRPHERESFAALPETLTIWRGAVDDQELAAGFGWSLSRSVATWFALRFKPPEALLAQGQIAKADAWAYLTERGEDEIVVPFERVTAIKRFAL